MISRDGFIITNNHVVEGASKIEVAFFNEDADIFYEAKIIGRDPLTDSALIQLVDAKRDLTEVKFGDSSQMQPGDWVVAIGNPFNYSYTVTVGVISATKRAYAVTDGRTNEMRGVTIYKVNPGAPPTTILARRGTLTYSPDGRTAILRLRDGEIHEIPAEEGGSRRYRRMVFTTHVIYIAGADLIPESTCDGAGRCVTPPVASCALRLMLGVSWAESGQIITS